MDKKNLQNILSTSFSTNNWREVLVNVFGVKRLHQDPIQIHIKNKEKAEAAFELGSFNTSDDRIIGLYLVKVKPEVWIERNKVGLREMLRSVYKHDVDGALIVFEQKDKWRLSFVSEIRVFDENGKISKKTTEPKRYTYLLGTDEKVKTPATRLASLSGKPFSLEDIRNAFSVESLNEEFYRVIAKYFYQLVGATEDKGAKGLTHARILQLPGTSADNRVNKVYQEFAVRLIGRTVFCWFLKEKKSDKGISLLPEHLLSSEAVDLNSNYYHFILERLFFQTLNTPMSERIKDLPKGSEQIPFLNGGLFEPQTEDFYKTNRGTGLSTNLNTLIIPDSWFKDFFEHLEQYNFTIDENSVVDIEVSVDPEMLGRIFENLLAEIDPDSGETARKATGSFYTPREIVDYMATESLVHYLHGQTTIDKESLQPIFKIDNEVSFSKNETEKILEALDRIKILDPACGSGAFPIGVMQKIVMALQKLDKDAKWWKTKQLQRIENPILRKQVKQRLEETTVEYARKIGIIQNSLYGVDVQPIAAEISKLRCFLTLVVDENIDENKQNRGVEPLPNLEFKFVTADTLMKLTDEGNFGGLFNANEDIDLLQQIRLEYLQSYGHHKQELKDEFEKIRNRISKQQLKLGKNIDTNSRAYKISSWDPFSHDKVDWFDPLWMFGVKSFDLVIGNPPYLRLQGVKATNPDFVSYAKVNYKSAKKGNWDMYVLFTERGYQLLNPSGVLAYIQPHKFFQADFGAGIRKWISDEKSLLKVVHFGAEQVFNSASNYTCLFFLENKRRTKFQFIDASSRDAWKRTLFGLEGHWIEQPNGEDQWIFSNPIISNILSKISVNKKSLGEITRKIFTGIQTSSNKVYVLEGTNLDEKDGLFDLYSNSLNKKIRIEKGLIKPFLMGDDIKRYEPLKNHHYVIFPYHSDKSFELMSEQFIKKNFPNGWKYLIENRVELEGRENGKMSGDKFFAYVYPKNLKEFEHSKLICPDISIQPNFTYDRNGDYYCTNTTYGLVLNDKAKNSLTYYLTILNSKLFEFFVKQNGTVLRGGYNRYLPMYMEKFPIHEEDSKQRSFETLSNYLLFLKDLPEKDKPLNEYVPNTHLIQQFEEIIDAMVFELYFKEDFKNAGLAFIEYVERDFSPIEGLTKNKAKQVIHEAYQKLREKDNEIRQNLKLMDIGLTDLIDPIKKAK
ncbi:MAG: Eco57I restriction-modification methylase domain-containing protein [Cyclobacteriaceae bacterium]|nr:Eco57I restriction-modification methylase domain-containing protein [Cyclobacteriaceae bacterium]